MSVGSVITSIEENAGLRSNVYLHLYGSNCGTISSQMKNTLTDRNVVLLTNIKNTKDREYDQWGSFNENKKLQKLRKQ